MSDAGTLLSRLFVVVLVVSAVGSVGVVADKHDPIPTPDDHDELRSAAFDLVPQNASLVTQNDLFPHVATRPNATYIPNAGTFEYYRKQYGLPTPEYIVYDTTEAWSKVAIDQYAALLGTKYGVYAYQDGIWIWKRGYHRPPRGITHKEPRLQQYALDAFALKQGRLSNGKIIATNVPKNWNIWYGPKTQLPPGTYAVTFRLSATGSNAEGPVARVDVTRSVYHKRIAAKPVTSTQGYENVTVDFTLHQPRKNIEFRGFSAGRGGRVELQSVTVERVGPAWAIAGLGEFGVNKGERKDGKIVGTNVSSGQTIWYGPYTTLPAGTYTVAYEVNATSMDATDGPVAALDVTVGPKHRRIAVTTVPPTNGSKTVRLKFTLNRTRRLVEFRGLSVTQNGTVKLKSVTVNRTETAKKNSMISPLNRVWKNGLPTHDVSEIGHTEGP